MKLNTTRKALLLAMGTAMGVMAAPAAMADANPFSATEMPSGYMQLAEGSCGGDKAAAEGSCGGDKAASEGSCGGDKAAAEGSCGGDKAKTEGSCGEGKCGQ